MGMPVTVAVNPTETVVHKTSMGTAKTELDVCKTPTPGGPVPTPYPNIAFSAQTANGSMTVKCDGNPIMLSDSYFSMSSGDEPGSLGGVKSNVIRGKADPVNYSFDVKVEGKGVFRRSDPMMQNNKNTV
jgi:Toxin PAAR-like domain